MIDRFWEKVEKGPYCWNWTGNKHSVKFGYGKLSGGKRGAIPVYAHRISYEFHKGPIPEGMVVMHVCDNPPCVNPDHLILGTHKDNSHDCMKKGRNNIGSRNGSSKLNRAQVMNILFLTASGIEQKVVADMFGIRQQTVSDIVLKKIWHHSTV